MEEINPIAPLIEKVKTARIPIGLSDQTLARLTQLQGLRESPTFLPELDRITRYIDWIANLPWDARTKDILDLNHTQEIMNKNHYGLQPLKDRVLEYVSIMLLKKEKSENIARAPILCFVGLVGTGKTTMAVSIEEALGR